MAINDDKKNIVKLAYLYFQEGRWDKAIEEYQKLLSLDPEDINTKNSPRTSTCEAPVEPPERCLIETPWEAARP